MVPLVVIVTITPTWLWDLPYESDFENLRDLAVAEPQGVEDVEALAAAGCDGYSDASKHGV